MTYYIRHRDQSLTAHEQPSGNMAVRLARARHAAESLHISSGEVLALSDKHGATKLLLKVRAFVPHVRYGAFTRSGHLVAEWTEEV